MEADLIGKVAAGDKMNVKFLKQIDIAVNTTRENVVWLDPPPALQKLLEKKENNFQKYSGMIE